MSDFVKEMATKVAAAPRAEPVHHSSGQHEADRVGHLESEHDVAVVDLAPAELRLKSGLENPDDLSIDVVDRDRKEQQRTHAPSHVASPCVRSSHCRHRDQIVGLRR